MRKRILAYRKKIDTLLLQDAETDWEALRAEHLVQIGFFQQERLIHLLVTALFALLEMLCVVWTLTAFTPGGAVLSAALLLLLIPYIAHYYVLENEVQTLYAQYDQIQENLQKCARGSV